MKNFYRKNRYARGMFQAPQSLKKINSMIGYSVLEYTYTQTIFLAVVQAIAELFPISSLGHTIIIPAWLGGEWKAAITGIQSSQSIFFAFIVELHFVTALVLFWWYRHRWFLLIRAGIVALGNKKHNEQSQYLVFLILGTLPTGIIAFLLEKKVRYFLSSPLIVSCFLIVNALILFLVQGLIKRRNSTIQTMNSRASFISGASQILALLPGISRSGISLSTALSLRIRTLEAIDFSFMLSTPLIFLAGLYKLPRFFHQVQKYPLAPFVAAFLICGVLSYLALRFLHSFLQHNKLWPFALYCALLGVVSLIHFSAIV